MSNEIDKQPILFSHTLHILSEKFWLDQKTLAGFLLVRLVDQHVLSGEAGWLSKSWWRHQHLELRTIV